MSFQEDRLRYVAHLLLYHLLHKRIHFLLHFIAFSFTSPLFRSNSESVFGIRILAYIGTLVLKLLECINLIPLMLSWNYMCRIIEFHIQHMAWHLYLPNLFLAEKPETNDKLDNTVVECTNGSLNIGTRHVWSRM